MPTKKQLIERWQNVERVLRELPPHVKRKHFDMATFGYETECGTVACAAGHCGLDPWFRRRGFRMDLTNEMVWLIEEDLGSRTPIHPLKEQRLRLDWSKSPRDFFGEDGAEKIFYNQVRRPVGQVIREVRAHIKELQSSHEDSK